MPQQHFSDTNNDRIVDFSLNYGVSKGLYKNVFYLPKFYVTLKNVHVFLANTFLQYDKFLYFEIFPSLRSISFTMIVEINFNFRLE